MFRPSELARSVADLLRDDAERWTADEFRVRHASGVAVWVANSSWGLHVRVPQRGKVIGAEVGAWTGDADQRHVWKAFLRWQKRPLSGVA